MYRFAAILTGTLAGALLVAPANAQTSNSNRGQRVFGACAACHSLEPNRNMTGPSLAELWNRKAGTLQSFHRYSPALQSSGIVWNDKTLDEWLKDPQHLVPGNTMTFQGIGNDQQRADLPNRVGFVAGTPTYADFRRIEREHNTPSRSILAWLLELFQSAFGAYSHRVRRVLCTGAFEFKPV